MHKIILSAMALLILFAPGSSRAEPDLKVALLPILDSLPGFIAEKLGLFEKRGLNVELLTVTGGPMRDQLMQAGEIDAMLNEMTSTAAFNRDGRKTVILCLARESAPGQPMFRILSSPASGISDLKDLAGKQVGVSRHTIIEYITERLIQHRGMDLSTVEMLSVPAIPERFQLLMQGRIAAGTLPDPLAWSAMKDGARLLADDGEAPEYAVSHLTFSAVSVDTKGEAIRGFLAAWDEAAARLNSEPEALRPLVIEVVPMPPAAQKDFPLPVYPRGKAPTQAQWADVMDWMLEKGLLNAPVPYETSVSAAYLPAVQ